MADPPERVLVTGAAGFIGRTLVDRFRALGSEVRGVDLIEVDDGHLVSADLSESGPWQRHAEGCDLVVHTAAVVGMYSSREGYWEANVVAPRLVMDAANRRRRKAVRPSLLDRRPWLRLRWRGG